ncbi:Integral membrane [Pyrenophora seminiperda CCB06]|uniref:Integral membrane n=1 Tax=Pyrenophora seminiperda CCB06 TaxID=1302712 RepID=A0A3M7MBG3_9PLEO|nr:Integral membrane [Pyrenophora seminiperda CCB06]
MASRWAFPGAEGMSVGGSRVTILLHAVRLLLALVILCLDAYAIHFSGDLAMVYSLILAISTILVCTYSIVCMRFFPSSYNCNLQVDLHWTFLFFWLVDLGLVGARAHQWQRATCSNSMAPDGHVHCLGVGGVFVLENGTAAVVSMYTGTLVAGAVLAGFEITLWATMTFLFIRSARKFEEIPPFHPHATTQMQSFHLHPPTTTTQNQPTHASSTTPPPHPRRVEVWETPDTEATRSRPQPILPDSDEEEEDDASTGGPTSTTAEDGDRFSPLVAQYVPQQAVERGFDPFVRRHRSRRQTPLRYWNAPPAV